MSAAALFFFGPRCDVPPASGFKGGAGISFSAAIFCRQEHRLAYNSLKRENVRCKTKFRDRSSTGRARTHIPMQVRVLPVAPSNTQRERLACFESQASPGAHGTGINEAPASPSIPNGCSRGVSEALNIGSEPASRHGPTPKINEASEAGTLLRKHKRTRITVEAMWECGPAAAGVADKASLASPSQLDERGAL